MAGPFFRVGSFQFIGGWKARLATTGFTARFVYYYTPVSQLRGYDMPARIRCIISVVFIAGILPGTVLPQTGPAPASHKHFLWEVRGDSSTMYITGSIHYLNPEQMYPLAPVFYSRLRKSARLFMEVNMNNLDTAAVKKLLLEKAGYPGGKTMEDAVPRSVYRSTMAQLQADGLDTAFWKRLQPMYLLLRLLKTELGKQGYFFARGLDMYLCHLADSLGIQVGGLETLEEQIESINQIPVSSQAAMLKLTILALKISEPEWGTILPAWKSGDTTISFFSSRSSLFPDVRQAILVGRNQRWLPRLERLLQSGETVFVVVGAGHLVEVDGLLNMLKRDGYSVSQL